MAVHDGGHHGEVPQSRIGRGTDVNIQRLCAEAGKTHREHVAAVSEIADPEATRRSLTTLSETPAPEISTVAPGIARSVASSTLPVMAGACSWNIAVTAATAIGMKRIGSSAALTAF